MSELVTNRTIMLQISTTFHLSSSVPVSPPKRLAASHASVTRRRRLTRGDSLRVTHQRPELVPRRRVGGGAAIVARWYGRAHFVILKTSAPSVTNAADDAARRE